jgi:hypothetical protein
VKNVDVCMVTAKDFDIIHHRSRKSSASSPPWRHESVRGPDEAFFRFGGFRKLYKYIHVNRGLTRSRP